jgi:hypothetical protein
MKRLPQLLFVTALVLWASGVQANGGHVGHVGHIGHVGHVHGVGGHSFGHAWHHGGYRFFSGFRFASVYNTFYPGYASAYTYSYTPSAYTYSYAPSYVRTVYVPVPAEPAPQVELVQRSVSVPQVELVQRSVPADVDVPPAPVPDPAYGVGYTLQADTVAYLRTLGAAERFAFLERTYGRHFGTRLFEHHFGHVTDAIRARSRSAVLPRGGNAVRQRTVIRGRK